MTGLDPAHPVRAVGGVVLLREDNAALLQLRDNKPGLNAAGLWVFPGGHCEPGESLEAGARREFREETGYDCGELAWVTTFLHPSEALHGDIGVVNRNDIVLSIGKSGETSELNELLRIVKKIGATIIAVTSGSASAASSVAGRAPTAAASR